MLDPEADIILACHKMKQDSATTFQLTWIRGHQDDHKPFSKLNDNAQLNVEVNEDTNKSCLHGPIYESEPYPGNGAMLIIQDKWVITRYHEQIQLASIRPKHIKWFLKKYKTKTIDDYNAQSIGLALEWLAKAVKLQ